MAWAERPKAGARLEGAARLHAFCGLELHSNLPDETTHCRFRNVLVKGGVYDELLAEVCRQVEARSILRLPDDIQERLVADRLGPSKVMLEREGDKIIPPKFVLWIRRVGISQRAELQIEGKAVLQPPVKLPLKGACSVLKVDHHA